MLADVRGGARALCLNATAGRGVAGWEGGRTGLQPGAPGVLPHSRVRAAVETECRVEREVHNVAQARAALALRRAAPRARPEGGLRREGLQGITRLSF